MLCLNLAPGDYLTIGDNVVVQVDRVSSENCKLMIHAPKEVPVLRGEVLERNGGRRPECVFVNAGGHRPRQNPISNG